MNFDAIVPGAATSVVTGAIFICRSATTATGHCHAAKLQGWELPQSNLTQMEVSSDIDW
jgi:hypothetical protein